MVPTGSKVLVHGAVKTHPHRSFTDRREPWIQVRNPIHELTHPVHERLAIKIIGLKSNRLPTPSLISYTHIDRIDQASFFALSDDGMLIMPGRDHVPQMTVVHQLYRLPRLHLLRDATHVSSLLTPQWNHKTANAMESEPDRYLGGATIRGKSSNSNVNE